MEQLDSTWHIVHIINEEEPFLTDDPGAPRWPLHVLPKEAGRAMEAIGSPNPLFSCSLCFY